MEVRREIWAGNADLGLIHLGTMGLDYIPQGQCSLRRDRNLRNSHINKGTLAEAEKEQLEVFVRLWKTEPYLSLYPPSLGQSLAPTVIGIPPMFVA